MAIDVRLIRALHVETLRREDVHADREPHVLFQASTLEALLEANYDGDLSFAELAEHGDLGLGTLDAVDGEMIAVDGRFERVRARSVARQSKPYPPMTEVVKGQHVFDLDAVDGTIVGFRFPDYARGINVPGYHLHFVAADRSRGGHMLECEPRGVSVQVDDSVDLHVELPAGIDLTSPDTTSDDALRRVERDG